MNKNPVGSWTKQLNESILIKMGHLCKSFTNPRGLPNPKHNINDTEKYCSKNSDLRLIIVTTSFRLSQAACASVCESVHILQYISELHSALRLSALSLQMASQLAALTLSLAEDCRGGTRYHPCPDHSVSLPGQACSHHPLWWDLSPPLMSKWHSMDRVSLIATQRQFHPGRSPHFSPF